MMQHTQVIQIGAGDKRQLPMDSRQPSSYQLKCLRGEGFLRVMSRTDRKRLQAGEHVILNSNDKATLTAQRTMSVMLIRINESLS